MPTCMRQQWPLHGDGQFASLQHLTTELSGCNQLTAPWNWVVRWVVDISVFQHRLCWNLLVLYCGKRSLNLLGCLSSKNSQYDHVYSANRYSQKDILDSWHLACFKLDRILTSQMWRHYYVIDCNEYPMFTSAFAIPLVHLLHFCKYLLLKYRLDVVFYFIFKQH